MKKVIFPLIVLVALTACDKEGSNQGPTRRSVPENSILYITQCSACAGNTLSLSEVKQDLAILHPYGATLAIDASENNRYDISLDCPFKDYDGTESLFSLSFFDVPFSLDADGITLSETDFNGLCNYNDESMDISSATIEGEWDGNDNLKLTIAGIIRNRALCFSISSVTKDPGEASIETLERVMVDAARYYEMSFINADTRDCTLNFHLTGISSDDALALASGETSMVARYVDGCFWGDHYSGVNLVFADGERLEYSASSIPNERIMLQSSTTDWFFINTPYGDLRPYRYQQETYSIGGVSR